MVEEDQVKSPIVYLKVSSLPADLDKKISKSESGCFICGIPFTKKSVTQTQRHVW